MEMMTQAPVWVWPLFVGLLALGLRATRTRDVPRVVFFGLPLLALLGLNSVAGIATGPIIWWTFGLAWFVSAAGGWRFGRGWVLGREGSRVRMRGEWLTLLAVMVLFWANYAAAALQTVAPEILDSGLAVAGYAAVLALASGQFAGRSIAVLQLR